MSERTMDSRETLRQIGAMNVCAISGGRWEVTTKGTEGETLDRADMLLPVSSGYKVRIALMADDTYTVTREMHRGAKVFVKGFQTNVYFDELGEVCYQASSYKSNDFGGHKVRS